ncbi:MAG: TonB-dependent receptor [Ignavibacteriales bacterium]
MIKKIVFLLFVPLALLAQDNKQNGQSVELPEFVITGVERVSLPTVTKPKASLVSTLSNEFLKPIYSPEDLPIAEISNPVKKEVTFKVKTSDYNGRAILGLGYYRLPDGELSYGQSFEKGVFFGKLFARNDRAYVSNAGNSYSGIDLASSFFTSDTGSFFPGTRFNLGGKYDIRSFNYFASDKPTDSRLINRGRISGSVSNLLMQNFKFGLNLSEDFISLSDNDVNEKLFSSQAFIETGYNGFIINAGIDYKNQNLNKKFIGNAANNFFESNASLKLKPSDDLMLGGGLYYAGTDTSWLFTPQFFFSFKINDEISLLGEFTPHADFKTVNSFVETNRYSNVNVPNVFEKSISNLKLAVKYEFDTYFELEGGVRYTKYKNFAYFRTFTPFNGPEVFDNFAYATTPKGRFDIMQTEANRFGGFVNLLFHLGPFGTFYGDVQLEDFQTPHAKRIPFNPAFTSNLSYSYDFSNGFTAGTKLALKSWSYADIQNKTEVPGFADLSFRLGYEIKHNFDIFSEVSNLFNRNNYYWYGYVEKPFDILFGIDYRW